MTFGIDVSGFQAGIEFGIAKQQGVEFVIVKASGFNTGSLYVASGYHAHIDRAVDAGLPKGHYYLTGGGKTPTEQAQWFVDNLYRFDPASDVLMLDNERLDSNGYLFTDAEATEFAVEVIRLTGVAPKRVWHYAGASDYRRAGSWPLLEQAGVRFVWAAYGDRPTGQTPDHEPSLQGSIPRWDVHQFTSSYQMPGWSGALDGLYSRHTITELFGGEASMEDQMRAFIAGNRKPADAATWDQMCGSLMFRFNSWRGWTRQPQRDISSAYRAAMGSLPLNADSTHAPVGAWHFFDIAGPGNGHVMQDARGGGLVCLSTGYALSESLGNAIGFQSVPGYIAAKGARYMGWATNYAGGTISVASTAGGGGTVIDNTPKIDPRLKQWRNEDHMYVFWKDQPRKSDSDPFTLYATYTDPNGAFRFRVVGGQERAVVNAVNLAVACDQGTIEGLAAEAGYRYDATTGLPIMNPLPKVEATVVISDAQINAWATKTAQGVLAGLQGEGGAAGATVGQIKQLLIDHVPTEFIAK